MTKKRLFGLLGKDIDYSFSMSYFKNKFEQEQIENTVYVNFDFQSLDSEFKQLLDSNEISGMNVTIPYKQEILPFLDDMDAAAREIGAVNTVKFEQGKRIGYNTDAYGFEKSLLTKLNSSHTQAYILGTGGASKAVSYVFNNLKIPHVFVSRSASESENKISYDQLKNQVMPQGSIIVNCSPVGTYPNVEDKPELSYDQIDASFLLFDLIYNPEKSAFLRAGEFRGAQIQNGYEMLVNQAEKSWEIWNN
ncbi:MAG: shikimate dehydrogenase family protein [Flavobacteriaceae bacterium]